MVRGLINYILGAAIWLTSCLAWASEYHGQVTFNGLPVPGATVTAWQQGKKFSTITDQQGVFSFADLAEGSWKLRIEMLCFEPTEHDITIAPNVSAPTWELSLLPLDKILAQTKVTKTESAPTLHASTPASSNGSTISKSRNVNTPELPKVPQESNEQAADGLLINGSESNAATTRFSLAQAFGNRRNGARSLYTGGLALILDNSTLDARPYSLTGLDTPKSSYNRLTAGFTLGGPLKIPHILYHGPSFFVGYQWTRDRDATTQSGLVPTLAERNGDFSGLQIFNPATGSPFVGNLPISSQAQSLLNFYPLPNVTGNSRYNYQVPILSNNHQDALQTRLDKSINHTNQVYGRFALQSTRSDNANLFGFRDTTDILGINTSINWTHRLSRELFQTTGFQFSRLRTKLTPTFANRENRSSMAGITGNNQDPSNWGPPALNFSSGIAPLSDGQYAFNRNRTGGVSYSIQWNHARHNVTAGGDFRRQEFNYLTQQDPRGTLSFTGAATEGTVNGTIIGGSDFADFLLGVPDTSSIAFGNADKYFRQSVYDAYITDDFRIKSNFTLNAGIRWEYGAPITELYGRLVNLDIATEFSAVAPILGNNPVGALTGQKYPSSLIRPDKRGIEPRVAFSWRPIADSTVVVRGGYGIYDDTSVYQSTVMLLAQQSPLSKSLQVQNSSACPLTLANGFKNCSASTANTYAVDPNFRVGYAQVWQLSAQSDLPGALQMTATYVGIKGTRGVQEYLPNTNPIGAPIVCVDCPVGFTYRSSNGNSTRESGQLQLRRRLRSGFTASVQYTFSKSADNDSVLGGLGHVITTTVTENESKSTTPSASPVAAQNWRDLDAERGPSTFDQRHLLNAQLQYTTGMGIGGGTLLSGWKGRLIKDWTILSRLTVGSGLPENPIFYAAVPGTGISNIMRPDTTGSPLHKAPPGLHLNPAAYSRPIAGQWGNAGRNSISGPSQFSFDSALARTFRLREHYNLDLRIDTTNLLNHVVFTGWNTTTNSSTFGLPAAANAMRSMQTTMRLRF
jgi:trimeric autotransporter adhesin